MARTPSGARMPAVSQPSTVFADTYPLPVIPASAIAVSASSSAGELLATHLNIPQSSSSGASNPFSLPVTADVTVIENYAARANQNVPACPIPAILPSFNTNPRSAPYGSSASVILSQSQSLSYANCSWLTAPHCSNVYPYRLFDHPVAEPRFGCPLHQTMPNYRLHEKYSPVPHRIIAVTLAPTT